MSKKRPARKQQQGQSSQNANDPGDNESLDDVLTALARAGYITMATSGDDITLAAVPDSLRVPNTVAPEDELAADTELFQQRRLPARIEKLLRRDAFGLWEHFKRAWLVPFLENATGESFATIWKRIEKHAPETAANDLVFHAMLGGFDFALVRYAEQLKRVPELAEWRQAQRTGVDKGHVTQSRERESRYKEIRDKRAELEATGKPCTYDVIAKEIGCSRSTVERAINGRPTTRPKR